MIHKRNKKKQIAEINVVPYIDVMLVLLVIFMVTTPLLSQGVKVDLPQAAANKLDTKQKEPIILSVDKNGNYYINIAANPNQTISPETLEPLIANEIKQSKVQGQNRQVLVKGDKNVDYGKVVEAMVLLQHSGAETVGLITDNPDAEKTMNN